MTYKEIIKNLQEVSNNYASVEEYEHFTNVAQFYGFLKQKFYTLEPYKNKQSKGNCKACYGRGFRIPNDGTRLKPCKCLKEIDNGS